MKKVTVKVTIIPPVQRQKKITLETSLNGQELVAYKTEKGTICVLSKLSREKGHDPCKYGFINMGYSNSGGPVFTAPTWFECVTLAAEQREVYAFDSYGQMMEWISEHGLQSKIKKAQHIREGDTVLVADNSGGVWHKRWFCRVTDHGSFEVSCNPYFNSETSTAFWRMCIPYDSRLEGTIVR